jgi:tRNA/rRNA methyltransferase
MEIIFILDQPAVPENIGASARALKTMGFSQMRIVNPKALLDEKAYWVAHGAHDIMEGAIVYPSIGAAVEDIDFVVGTTAKNRRIKHDHYPVKECISILNQKKDQVQQVAILFGREESGLSNEALSSCDILTHVPMKTLYPSLNLGQAVMIMAYELSGIETATREQPREEESYRIVKTKVQEILHDIDFHENRNIYNRVMERLAICSTDDIHLIHSIINKLKKKWHERKI